MVPSSNQVPNPIRYRVKHTTHYRYSDPVPLSQNQLRLTPRNRGGQKVLRRKFRVTPEPEHLTHRRDYFANTLSYFDIYRPHEELIVTMVADVELSRMPLVRPTVSVSWESIAASLQSDFSANGLHRYQFTFASPLVPECAAARDYALKSFTKDRPIVDAILELNQRIHKDFTYDPSATTVSTPVAEVFHKRRGVCQDLAHVGIACLRSMKLASRYVSGYVRTYRPAGQAQLVGADASHAWLSVFAGPFGWIDIDPTNNLVVQNEHITLAVGRDYRDVCPINGLFIGGGQQTLEVAVKMKVLTGAEPE